MKNFALIGASGYIAPRHMEAISKTNNNLVAAFDPYDGIGILDKYFPNASYFKEFERFDRYINKLRYSGKKLDFLSITSPNYLHDSHIRFGLKNNCDIICEKPLVLNPHNVEQLILVEKETGKKVNTILQLRLHPSVIKFKKKVLNDLIKNPKKIFEIDLTYITSRGKWYFISWKGDDAKSGGISSNIGIHFFDMLNWVFGPVIESKVHLKKLDTHAGILHFKNANVRWFLSINQEYIPENLKKDGVKTYRSLKAEDKKIEFSSGFKDLHLYSYEKILKGEGFGLIDSYESIKTVSLIRNQKISDNLKNSHSYIKKIN